MLTIKSAKDQTTNTTESATLDVEVTIVQGSQFIDSHTVTGKLRKPTYFVELELDNVKRQTSGGHKAKDGRRDWDECFIFAANRSSRLSLKLYCKHSTTQSDHVIGEATHDVWDIPRHKNETINLHDAKRRVAGKITLHLTVATTVTFSAGPAHSLDLQSSYSLNQMTKMVESLSGKELDKFSPVWCRFIQSFDTVASRAQKSSELHPPVKVALGAVAFALKIVLQQIDRDEKVESMIGIMGDLYAYVADAYTIQKITSYKETLRKLLAQTTECSYFIGDYRKVTQFAQRAMVNLVSDADTMIKKFEDTFRDLKIELVLGSSLQTAIVSFRVLQKVENIETILYINKLKPLGNVGWDSGRTCLRGTRNVILNDLVQWASNSNESGTAKNDRICVLQGPQGCGKTSIAHSIAQAFHLQNRLGAAIFLDDRTEEKLIGSQILSTTIASQLAAYDQNIREAIAAKIEADASLAKADVERQFRDLIVSATKGLEFIGPICIVIDGLQKIGDPAEQLLLLTVIADHFTNLPSSFRLLLTSEDERTSEDIAQLMPDCVIKDITFDDEGAIVDYDKHISQSLRHLFSKKSKLAEKYSIEEVHDQFIKRSMGVYFWISTALQFLLLCADGDECTILKNILSTERPRTKEVAMDQLFRIILTSIPEAVHLICWTLMRSSTPVRLPLQDLSAKVSPVTASQSPYQFPILNMVQPFLMENGRDQTDNPLFTIHPSLEDFLTSSRRCHGTNLYVDRLDLTPSLTMVEICFDLMERGLRRNICRVDDVMVLNEEIPDRDKRLGQYIPVTLQYACRNWMFHVETLDLADGDKITAVLERLDTFLSKHLLHWIECMSLLGWVDFVSTSLNGLSSWLSEHIFSPDDVRRVLTMDAIQFIHAFAPIISKAAMQTYLSALPLMPSGSLLLEKYSAMSRPSLKLSGLRCSDWAITDSARVILSTRDTIDTKPGNKIGSPVEDPHRLIAFSPDGQWIATQNIHQRALDIWNVHTRSYSKTIAKGSGELGSEFKCIAYSANGTKVMIVTSSYSKISQPVYIWDIETDTLVKRLEVSKVDKVAISPDGSQIALAYKLYIRIIDVCAGTATDQPIRSCGSSWTHSGTHELIWSPNGQFLACAVISSDSAVKTEIYLLSLSGSKLGSWIANGFGPSIKYMRALACSRDSSKVAAVYGGEINTVLSIWCTRTGILIGTTRLGFISGKIRIAFTLDGDILICEYDLARSAIVLRLNVVPTHFIQTYTHYPPQFHPSQTPLTIESSHDTQAMVDYASQVDADGWILNTKGERQIWTPWDNYELSCSCKPPPREGQTHYKTLEVKDPDMKTVVLRYVIAFELEDVNQTQEIIVSVE